LKDDIDLNKNNESLFDESICVEHNMEKVDDITCVYFKIGSKVESVKTNIFFWENLKELTYIKGPCIILLNGSTIVVDPACVAYLTNEKNIIIELECKKHLLSGIKAEDKMKENTDHIDTLELSLFANRFMTIAEQMGKHLQKTSISTNIKERLDFSCALFDNEGNLVANAPHLPVHLGAMQEAVKGQIQYLGANWKHDQVILTNHPSLGGSHLPDLTVITPVALNHKVEFYLANRGHHSDIGGITPGSMPPFSKTLIEEGAAIKSLKIRHIHTLHDIQLASPSGLMIKGEENSWQQNSFPVKLYTFICRKLFNQIDYVISPSKLLLIYYL
jgi:5-oxoprolinase (ATP-hydrolysing)